MTRIIQLTGALLGTLIGFALGLTLLQRAGDLIEPANRPAFLTAFVVATLLFSVDVGPFGVLLLVVGLVFLGINVATDGQWLLNTITANNQTKVYGAVARIGATNQAAALGVRP